MTEDDTFRKLKKEPNLDIVRRGHAIAKGKAMGDEFNIDSIYNPRVVEELDRAGDAYLETVGWDPAEYEDACIEQQIQLNRDIFPEYSEEHFQVIRNELRELKRFK